MKILGGGTEPTLEQLFSLDRIGIGKLRQDQFAFETFTVLDTVIMGHGELWEVKQERDRIYALPEMSEEDGYKSPSGSKNTARWTVIPLRRARANCC